MNELGVTNRWRLSSHNLNYVCRGRSLICRTEFSDPFDGLQRQSNFNATSRQREKKPVSEAARVPTCHSVSQIRYLGFHIPSIRSVFSSKNREPPTNCSARTITQLIRRVGQVQAAITYQRGTAPSSFICRAPLQIQVPIAVIHP